MSINDKTSNKMVTIFKIELKIQEQPRTITTSETVIPFFIELVIALLTLVLGMIF